MMPRAELWEWWRHPDASNQPRGYLNAPERSAFLVGIVTRHLPFDARILELGCNSGRNLAALHRAGYRRLSGIELNPDAVAILRENSDLTDAVIVTGPIEDTIGNVGPFDLIFTMAVLEHLHPDSEWVFGEMASHARTILTIEDERGISGRHCPRDYGAIFRDFGLHEIETWNCASVPGLGSDFMARMFA